MTIITKNDTVIASDWHLGFPGTQTKKINAFLDELIGMAPFKKLILNGDIFDLNWRRFDKILSEHKEILKKILTINQAGTKVIYTLGNHDPLTRKQKNYLYATFNKIGLNDIRILQAYQMKRNGFIYLINHGHMFDTFLADHKLLYDWSDIGYRITIAFDNFLGIGLTELFARTVRKITKWSETYERRCRRYLRSRKYDALILGHTHEPKIIEWQLKEKRMIKLTNKLKLYLAKNNQPSYPVNKYYFNSGDWAQSAHCTYLTISDNGQTKLHYFE